MWRQAYGLIQPGTYTNRTFGQSKTRSRSRDPEAYSGRRALMSAETRSVHAEAGASSRSVAEGRTMKDPLQTEETPYEVLGVASNATDADVEKAFRSALKNPAKVERLM